MTTSPQLLTNPKIKIISTKETSKPLQIVTGYDYTDTMER